MRRGPLGPASYRVEVSAAGEAAELAAESQAELDVEPRRGGATFRLRTKAGNVFETRFRTGRGGALVLEGVRGAPVGPGTETDLASLAGQLDPPLPPGPVRLGDEWSRERRISIKDLTTTLRTALRIVRYRRVAGADAAELEGRVRGELRTQRDQGVVDGTIRGTTRIVWSVAAGRVAESQTRLVWTIRNGGSVVLETNVRPA